MVVFFMSLLMSMSACAEQVTITHAHKQQLGLRIAYIGCAAERVAPLVSAAMMFSGQFTAAITEYRTVPAKRHEITDLMQQQIYFLLILESHQEALEYRLYDTTTGAMIPNTSGRCILKAAQEATCAQHIADQLYTALTGQPSPFYTHIAYAKEVPYKKGMTVKHICVVDYDGSNELVLVNAPTISIAPRWGGTAENPLLFYSEYANTNVRLMVVNRAKKRKV